MNVYLPIERWAVNPRNTDTSCGYVSSGLFRDLLNLTLDSKLALQ
jgi:hypothetical protein